MFDTLTGIVVGLCIVAIAVLALSGVLADA